MIVISSELKNVFMNEYGVSENIIECLSDGVTLENFEGISYEIPIKNQNELDIGYVGLYKGSGIELITELSILDLQDRYSVIGGTEIEQLQYKNKESRVHFSEHIPNAEVPKRLSQFDILLMPYQVGATDAWGNAKWRWMSPMKMFEYMAAGKIT